MTRADQELDRGERALCRARDTHSKIVDDVPQLKCGIVWCHKCGHSEPVDSARCLATGWPLHCGETMSIDSPEERAALPNPTGSKEDMK